MSISSEDDFEGQEEDEEELLQRELKEHARRDLQYTRPGNHPPPIVSRAAAGPPSRNPPPAPLPNRPPPLRPSVPRPQPDPDDESDVELLSISSEDDEPTERRPAAPRAPVMDLEDDAEEPTCWKQVDESELARMVREMRETKLSVVTLKRAPTYKRKTSAISEGYPRGDDFIDPLGLGVVDMRNLSLVKENASSGVDEGVENGRVLAAAKDSALRDKVMYHSEKFDPKLFLSHVHQNTAHADLEAGEQSLKMDLHQRKQQLKLLVKENFDCFVSCKNTIDDIHMKLQHIEADTEGAGTVHLSTSIDEVSNIANRAFGPLFERQVQADRIRSVQGMLQRFRTLFNLPNAIRGYIIKGDYDLAVREYKKAKSLVLPTHVRVLKRVLEEVEKIISELKDKLYKSMEDSNVEISQLETTIRLLLELEPNSDPVWHYLTIQDIRIRTLLEACSMEHDEQMEQLQRQLWKKAQLDAQWKKIQQDSNKASNADFSSLFGEQKKDLTDGSVDHTMGEQSDVLLSRLIRRLSFVVMQDVPPFWQLAVAIFNGKFAKVSQGGFSKVSGDEVSAASGADATVKGHVLNEVVGMVTNILTLYESKVLNAFLGLSESDILGPYMRNAVLEVSKVCLALKSKDAAPPTAVQVLFALKLQLARHFILRLCSFIQTASLTSESQGEWVPVSTIERASSEFAISGLPLHFQHVMISRTDEIKEMLRRLKSSEGIDLVGQVHQLEDSVKSTFFNCFFSLRDLLDKLASKAFKQCQELESKALNGGDSLKEEHFTGLQAGVEVTNPHQRLLIVLSNAGYCRSTLIPHLSQKYQDIWAGKELDDIGSSMMEKLMAAFSSIEENILGQYTRTKATLIGTAAAAFFLEDGLQWGAAPPVKGIRDAAVEVLHPLIEVHAELNAGAKPYLDKALPILIEGLVDALSDVFNENKSKALRVVDLKGFSQLILELDYLEAVLRSHFTAAAQSTFSSMRNQLKEKTLETIKEAQALGIKKSAPRTAEDGLAQEERFQGLSVSLEELNALEQQVCDQFLQFELKRTRLIIVCFTNVYGMLQPENTSPSNTYSSGRLSTTANSTFNHRIPPSPGYGAARHRRFQSTSSLSDNSDSGRPLAVHPSQSPLSQSGYVSSDVGSESGGHIRSSATSERRNRLTGDISRPSRRTMFGTTDDDFR